MQVHYSDYLKLEQILQAQKPLCKEHSNENKVFSEEHLFIITHQVYELWFKQIHLEVDCLLSIFSQQKIDEKQMNLVHAKIDRMNKVFEVLVKQLDILETMTPMDFLEFRNYLAPASGFQSVQFRKLEMKLGISMQDRPLYPKEFFLKHYNEQEKIELEQAQRGPNLVKLFDFWLARFPFLQWEKFDFWDEYEKSVRQMFKETNNEDLLKSYLYLTDQTLYQKDFRDGKRKFSQKAMLSSLFIMLYRDEPLLSLPFKVLMGLMDFDEKLTLWRYRHSIMAQRMLGSKIGTGGSSGHQYLKQTTLNSRIFEDLYDLSSFLLPTSHRPALPLSIKRKLNFEI